MLLLSRRNSLFLAGIAAFFAAHIAFSSAFTTHVVSVPAMLAAFAAAIVFSGVVLHRLWKFLRGPYKIAVPLYAAAIVAMVSLAVGAAVHSLPASAAAAAAAFAVSDVFVARDRFVRSDNFNRAWGLPLYYAAQIIFAASVAGAG